MYAIATSMLRTAPAQAAVADGIGMSAIPANLQPEPLVHAKYWLGIELFRKEGNRLGMGSEGAMVS